MSNSELDRQISVLNELLKDGQITRESHYHQVLALKTQYQVPPKSRQCPKCLEEKKKTWGTHKRGSHYFCEAHKDVEFIERTTSKPRKGIKYDKARLEARILKHLETAGPTRRDDLCDHLSIPRTTMYDYLFRLEKRKLVIKYRVSSRGRPVYWEITDKALELIQVSRSKRRTPTKKNISRRSEKTPTETNEDEKCPKHPDCIFFKSGKCESMERISFMFCEGGYIPFENPSETTSKGSKSTKKLKTNTKEE